VVCRLQCRRWWSRTGRRRRRGDRAPGWGRWSRIVRWQCGEPRRRLGMFAGWVRAARRREPRMIVGRRWAAVAHVDGEDRALTIRSRGAEGRLGPCADYPVPWRSCPSIRPAAGDGGGRGGPAGGCPLQWRRSPGRIGLCLFVPATRTGGAARGSGGEAEEDRALSIRPRGADGRAGSWAAVVQIVEEDHALTVRPRGADGRVGSCADSGLQWRRC
jgi:hypothetical protein